MTTTDSSVSFSPSRFLNDLKKLAAAIGAPYSEPRILAVLTTFEECFKRGVVVWRTTHRPNDTLNYRVFLRRCRIDTISMATEAGFLDVDNPLAKLVTSLGLLFNGGTEQWCDFDPCAGLVKTWVNLEGRRPLDDVLNASVMPASIRGQGPKFHHLGLELVTFVAADYQGCTINLYFVAPGPVTQAQAMQYCSLAGSPAPTDQELEDMVMFLNPQGYHLAVTMEYQTGTITRVAFYAFNLPPSQAPAMDGRLSKFFAEAPSYDQHQTRIVAWSFGLGGSKYMKAESSYVGELHTLGTLVRDSGDGAPPS